MGCFKLMYCSIKFQFKLYVSLFYDKALKLKLFNMFDFLTLYVKICAWKQVVNVVWETAK